MALRISHSAYMAVIALYFLALLLTLAGISATFHTCNDNEALFSRLGGNCRRLMRMPLFVLLLGLIPLIPESGALIHRAASSSRRSAVGAGASLFAVVAALFIVEADNAYKASEVMELLGASSKVTSRFKVALAGFAIGAAFALLLLLIAPLCTADDQREHASATTAQSNKSAYVHGAEPTGGVVAAPTTQTAGAATARPEVVVA